MPILDMGAIQSTISELSETRSLRRFIYQEGTDNLSPVYADPDLTTTRDQPAVSDENGQFQIAYLEQGTYRVVIKDQREKRVVAEQSGIEVSSTREDGTIARFACVQDLTADWLLSYGLQTGRRPVQGGEAVLVAEDALHYAIAPEAATDHHVETAGGVKLYVRSGASGRYNVKAFGARLDGTTDDSAAVQKAFDFGNANPGVTIFFPKGACRITTPIDCTYTGAAAGITSSYYGFSVEGSDPFNSILKCETAGAVTFDLTGKPRMTFRNLSFVNYTNGAHNPSAYLLLARNLTNSYAGGHFFERCTFRGYATDTLVQTASSETNMWLKCDFEPYLNGCSGFELTGQIETSVVSPFIDLSSHTFSGGNTWQMFIGCAFNSSIPATGTHAVRVSEADIVTFDTCYSHGKADCTFLFGPTANENIKFNNHRHEADNTTGDNWWMEFAADVESLEITGRSARGIHAQDGVTISKSRIAPQFVSRGDAAHSLDAYDLIDCDVSGITNECRVRNSARGTRFHDVKQANEWSLPSGETTAPEFYWLGYIGGYANYRRKVEYRDKFNRHEIGRTHIAGLVTPLTQVNPANGTYTPDYNISGAYQFTVDGALTIANPNWVNFGPDDPAGQRLVVVIVQDATGGHTVSWGNRFDLQGAAVNTAANAQTVLEFVFIDSPTGKNWVRVS